MNKLKIGLILYMYYAAVVCLFSSQSACCSTAVWSNLLGDGPKISKLLLQIQRQSSESCVGLTVKTVNSFMLT